MKRKIFLGVLPAIWALQLAVSHGEQPQPWLELDFRKEIPETTSGKVSAGVEIFEKGGTEPAFRKGKDGGMVTFAPTTSVGGGLRLLGVEGQSPVTLAEPEDEISIAAWVKLAANPNKGKQTVVGNLDDAEQSGWLFGIYPGGSLFFFWTRTEASPTIRRTESLCPDGEWHHVAMVWRNSDERGLAFYVDGLPAETLTGDGRPGAAKGNAPLPRGEAPLAVGAASNGRFPFPGSIREIKIFDRALSDEEIFQLAQTGSGAE
jgi:hypothetical protein